METAPRKFKTVDEYLSYAPAHALARAEEMRRIIREAAPQAAEIISYNMPAYRQQGILVYFAAYKGHIGFYPTGSPIPVFAEELRAWKTSKGAIQFPLDQPIPADLVRRIVAYRLEEDAEKAKGKKRK